MIFYKKSYFTFPGSSYNYIPTACSLPRPVKKEFAEPVKNTKPDMQCSNTKNVGFFSGLLGHAMKYIGWS